MPGLDETLVSCFGLEAAKKFQSRKLKFHPYAYLLEFEPFFSVIFLVNARKFVHLGLEV